MEWPYPTRSKENAVEWPRKHFVHYYYIFLLIERFYSPTIYCTNNIALYNITIMCCFLYMLCSHHRVMFAVV